jgi:hypothetical protein
MPIERSRRAVRLATGTALCTALSYGLALPVPFIAPVLAWLLLSTLNQPLPWQAAVKLALVAAITTSIGLLLIEMLRYYPVSAVLLVGCCLYLTFAFGLRGGNALVVTFVVIGLCLISSAGVASFDLAAMVIAALLKGLILAMVTVTLSHGLFPETASPMAPVARPVLAGEQVRQSALQGVLIVLPTFVLALLDPASFLPIILKAATLGQQSSALQARHAGRELVGSTLLGGLLAVAFWCALSLFVHLWMLLLWMLLFGLLLARRQYGLASSRFSPGFWLNTMLTMIILLGQSIQDSALGKDVYTAFAVRMGLFTGLALYAGLMVRWLGGLWRAAQRD